MRRSVYSYKSQSPMQWRLYRGTDGSDKADLEEVVNYGAYAPIVERLVKKRRAPGEEMEAAGCVGAPSNFNLPQPQITHPTINWPDGNPDPDENQEEEAQTLQYEEVWRDTSTIKVTNPNDSGQFVDVERINKIRFKGPDGHMHQFNLKWGS